MSYVNFTYILLCSVRDHEKLCPLVVQDNVTKHNVP
jgi:hypothetical protein